MASLLLLFYFGFAHALNVFLQRETLSRGGNGSVRPRYLLPALLGIMAFLYLFITSSNIVLKVLSVILIFSLFPFMIYLLHPFRRLFSFFQGSSGNLLYWHIGFVIRSCLKCLGSAYIFFWVQYNVIFLLMFSMSLNGFLTQLFLFFGPNKYVRDTLGDPEKHFDQAMSKRKTETIQVLSTITVVSLLAIIGFSVHSLMWICVAIFLVAQGLYNYFRSHYLTVEVRTEMTKSGYQFELQGSYVSVYKMSGLSFYLSLIVFLAYCAGFFELSHNAIRSFYGVIAPVSANMLAIVTMFGVLFLQREAGAKGGSEKPRVIANGLKGFAMIFTIILITAIIGSLTISESGVLSIGSAYQFSFTKGSLGKITESIFFEFMLFFVPSAMLYLFAMISDFLATSKPPR